MYELDASTASPSSASAAISSPSRRTPVVDSRRSPCPCCRGPGARHTRARLIGKLPAQSPLGIPKWSLERGSRA
jgi:hypothetical protein